MMAPGPWVSLFIASVASRAELAMIKRLRRLHPEMRLVWFRMDAELALARFRNQPLDPGLLEEGGKGRFLLHLHGIKE
jgi:hypothetical protein